MVLLDWEISRGPSRPSHSGCPVCVLGLPQGLQGGPFPHRAPPPTALCQASTKILSCAPPCFVSASLRAGVIISLLSASSFFPAPAAPSSSSCSLCWKTRNYSQLEPGIISNTGAHSHTCWTELSQVPQSNSCFPVVLHLTPLSISNLGQ